VSDEHPPAAEAPPSLSELPPVFRWLLAGTFVSSLATFVFPFLALFLTGRGFSVAEAGLVTGLFGGGSIVSGPLSGWCADRFGRRPTLVASLVSTAALTALLAAATSPAALALAAAALGVAASAWRPAANALVADAVAEPHRARAYGLMHWVNNIGVALSFAAGGALAGHGYPPLFLADAATTLAFAALVLWRIPETRPSTPTSTSTPTPTPTPTGYAAVLSDRHFLALLALLFALLVPFCQFMTALPVAMARQGIGAATYGRVMAVNGTLIALLQPALSRRAARFDQGAVLALSALLVGLGYGGYALAATPLGWGVATAVWSFGEILLFPAVGALVAALSPRHLRGRYQGALSTVFGLGLAAAPPLGGLVLDRLGATTLWLGCLAAALLVAAGHLLVAGPRRRALAGAALAVLPSAAADGASGPPGV